MLLDRGGSQHVKGQLIVRNRGMAPVVADTETVSRRHLVVDAKFIIRTVPPTKTGAVFKTQPLVSDREVPIRHRTAVAYGRNIGIEDFLDVKRHRHRWRGLHRNTDGIIPRNIESTF